jgi:hypothetical protein
LAGKSALEKPGLATKIIGVGNFDRSLDNIIPNLINGAAYGLECRRYRVRSPVYPPIHAAQKRIEGIRWNNEFSRHFPKRDIPI